MLVVIRNCFVGQLHDPILSAGRASDAGATAARHHRLSPHRVSYDNNHTVQFSFVPVFSAMKTHQLMRDLRENNGSKIVMIVADGLGGLALEPDGKTELETARTPNLDMLV